MNSVVVMVLIAVLLVPWVLAVLLMLLVSRLRRDPRKRWQDFMTALGLTVLIYCNTRLTQWLAQHVPHTIDGWLWRSNVALHVDPLALVYFMEEHALLSYLLQAVYSSLPIVIAIAWLTEQSLTLRRAVAIAAVGGWIFSAIFPAVGPHWYLDGYTVTSRHCIPAVDWTWALLAAVNSRGRLRPLLWIYAASFALASVLLGEHYLIDLIVALPFTFAVQQLAARWPGLEPKPQPPAEAEVIGEEA
jgi:hypothetical protein